MLIVNQNKIRLFVLAFGLVSLAACGGKGRSTGGGGTVNPPEPTGKMQVESGVFYSGTVADSNTYSMKGYFTPYETPLMESDGYQALHVTIQAFENGGVQ